MTPAAKSTVMGGVNGKPSCLVLQEYLSYHASRVAGLLGLAVVGYGLTPCL